MNNYNFIKLNSRTIQNISTELETTTRLFEKYFKEEEEGELTPPLKEVDRNFALKELISLKTSLSLLIKESIK